MATVNSHGFTVIELMLFLGITGALFAALMFGVNTNITQQRYRESVLAYSSLLENQYFEVSNTRNERSDELICDATGAVSQPATGGKKRGTTTCVLLGKAVQIRANGTEVKIQNVIGIDPGIEEVLSDIDSLKAHQPRILDTFGSDSIAKLDWQSSLVTEEKLPSEAAFLILRSPATGLLRVFTSVNPLPADLTQVLTREASSGTGILLNCIDGQTGSAPVQSVTIDPRIGGPQGVIVKEADQRCA